MSRVNRLDYAISGSLAPPQRLDNGFLKVEGRISRVGIQEYRDSSGKIRRELRIPEEVFHADSLASFTLLPLTNNHPEKLLDSKTAAQHTVGAIGEPRVDGDYAAAALMIYDSDAIAAAEAGRSQLSCGYSCEIDETQDEVLAARWGKYDGIQRNIRGNHVALVDRARAGSGAALRLDSGDAEAVFLNPAPPSVGCSQEKTTMAQLKIGPLTLDAIDANTQALVDREIATAKKAGEDLAATEKARADEAEKTAEKLRGELAGLQSQQKLDADELVKCDECATTGKVDGAECKNCEGKGSFPKKMDSLERRTESRKRSVEAGAERRLAVLDDARRVLGAGAALTGKSEQEIRKLVVAKKFPDQKLDGKTDGFVEGLYAAALAQTKPVRVVDDARRAVLKVVEEERDDARPSGSPGEARDRMIARERAANNGGK